MRASQVLKRVLLGVVGLGVAFTAVVGVAHTRPGRPLLGIIGPMLGMGPAQGARKGGCPFGFDVAASPAQREASRTQFAATHHGDWPALSRPALGFTFDRTTRSDVMSWAAEHHVQCTKPKSGVDLNCAHVPDSLLPPSWQGAPVTNLWMNFGEGDRLISLVALRSTRSAETIGETFGKVSAAMTAEAGPPVKVDGDASPAGLSAGLLRQASVEYRFRDYYAVARATNMGHDGFLLTEEYRSLPN
jgi:hypothetical protein